LLVKDAAERLARRIRVAEAARRGIRLVPPDPDPKAFPYVEFACDVRPLLCKLCNVEVCPFGEPNGRSLRSR
jgi:hypothetical protein